jgi:hypothetical protein
MKRFIAVLLFAFAMIGVARAQSVLVSGTVKTSQGDLLRYAFVREIQGKSGVYTDSLGNFTLAVNPNAMLRVSCLAYRDTVFKVSGNGNITILLKPAVIITASNDRTISDAGATQINKQQLADRILNNTPVNGENNVPANNSRTAIIPAISNNPASDGTTKLPSLVGMKGYTFIDGVAAAMGDKVPDRKDNDAITQGDAIVAFSHREATQGSRYFFKNFVQGYVINAQDSLVQDPVFQLDYDKIGGNLLLTKDRRTVIAVYNEKVKSFTLFDALNQPYSFTLVPAIDKTHYVQVIADGNNYKIYKAVKTTFVASNYSTNGLTSTGNNYDEYQDEYTYYLLNVKANQVQKISLKKKALKLAFAADETKADSYFKTNDSDIDDNYLAALGDYMNK